MKYGKNLENPGFFLRVLCVLVVQLSAVILKRIFLFFSCLRHGLC